MNLLPKSSKEFSSKEYWNEFFSNRGTKSFEWYGEYAELCKLLFKYMKYTDNVLVAGCGNSVISIDLYKSGYRNITNIDISEIVIKQMQEKFLKDFNEVNWVQGDLLNMKFEADTFSCIFDKGTLDALMSNDDEKAALNINKYFEELHRVLRLGGRYICVSLLQQHILASLLEWFPSNGYIVRFCRCEDAEQVRISEGSFSFPVFVVVCTKMKKMENFKPVIEVNLHEAKPERVDATQVKESVEALQQFAFLRQRLNKNLSLNEDVHLDLCDMKTGLKRYSLYIVDSPKSRKKPFAVFIVPHGRESEWLFKSKAGHLQLSESASCSRLVVVHLMRNQVYGTMKDVQDELASKVIELASMKLPKGYQIPFLSVGDGLGERKEVFRGVSDMSGEFIVEDVKDDSTNSVLRRLVFLQSQNVIQSEAKLICGKKKRKKKTTIKEEEKKCEIDFSYLACAHHSVMLLSLELLPQRGPVSLLLVGLGGGGLPSFIHSHFPKVKVTAVDIDEAMVNVAKNWFGLNVDSRLSCEVEDGIQFINTSAENGKKYDIIVFDVDSKEVSEGLSCPPKQFLEKDFLSQVAKCLSTDGLFTLNLVCRDKNLKEKLQEELKTIFHSVFAIDIPEEVNVVLFCKINSSHISVQILEKKINNLNKYLKSRGRSEDVLELNEIVSHFKVL